jgi:hypothetical protein
MDVLLRIFVGVAAAWITPDPLPQQGHASGYEERCTDARCRLRLVR